MTYWILPKSGMPILCDSVQRVTNAELLTTELKDETAAFTTRVNLRLEALAGTVNIDPDIPACRIFDIEREDQEFIEEFNRVIDDPNIPHAEDANPEANFEPEIEPDN